MSNDRGQKVNEMTQQKTEIFKEKKKRKKDGTN